MRENEAFWAQGYPVIGGKKNRNLLDRSVDVLNVEDFIKVSEDGANDIRNAIQRACNAAQADHRTVVLRGTYRLVVGKPIVIGTCNIRFEGAKIYCSLPDGYTNPNNAVTENYTALNQIDEFGALVNYPVPAATNLPWNGKTQVFTAAVYSVIENAWIDWGWGSTSVPSGVHPITGNRNDDESFTYYQGFNNCQNTNFVGCYFKNAPGAHIEVGHDLVLDTCSFEEWGDHSFYCGQDAVPGTFTQKNYKIIDCNFYAQRAAVGTVGQIGYVFATFRDTIKLRGNSNSIIRGNDFNDASGVITGVYLEVNDAQAGDVSKVTIDGNHFKGGVFVDCFGFRNNGGFGAVDYRIKHVKVTNNNVEFTNQGVRFRAACDSLTVHNNEFYGTGTVASFMGHPKWNVSMKGVKFTKNFCQSSAAIHIYLGGIARDIKIQRNDFYNTGAPCNTSSAVIQVANPFDVDIVPIFHLPSAFSTLLIEDNYADNFFSWIADSGYPAYNAGTTYPFTIANGIDVYSVVAFGGVLYRNLTATVGSAPGGANWTPFTRGASVLTMRRNTRSCSSASVTPLNSTYGGYLSGASALLRMTYTPQHEGNVNTNTLGEVVGFSFASISDQEFQVSSRYKTLAVKTLISGDNFGALNNFSEVNVVNDFDFKASGACDQFGFFTGDNRNGSCYLDHGRLGLGTFILRVFPGTGLVGNCAISLHSLGRLYFGEPSDASAPFDSSGAGSPEGVVTAPPGSTYRNTTGGAGTTLYDKESGTGNTGWAPVGSGGGGGSNLTGSGAPEGAITASPGARYWDTVGKRDYVKDNGIGNTGWQELTSGA